MATLRSETGVLAARLAYVILSTVESALIVTIYGLSLSALGEVLQRREKEILRVVAQEVE
ncbi:MAG TPA: hypothetical protein PKH24_07300 [Sedimentisphaerales bacterium]|nr:hypothetical protein [Sedimentisphaerales bacterium]HNU30629.1 hypothetical protein [Sedimentisphaerales bacterium]